MKYKITLKGTTYEVEVEKGEAMILDEYEAKSPVPPAPAAAAPVAAAPAAAAPAAVAAGTKVEAPLPGNVFAIKVKDSQANRRLQGCARRHRRHARCDLMR